MFIFVKALDFSPGSESTPIVGRFWSLLRAFMDSQFVLRYVCELDDIRKKSSARYILRRTSRHMNDKSTSILPPSGDPKACSGMK